MNLQVPPTECEIGEALTLIETAARIAPILSYPHTILRRLAFHRDALHRRSKLNPIETAPKDGSYILLFGPSGYTSTPLRCEVCCFNEGYKFPWRNHSNDSFEDGGHPPTHWMELPSSGD